MIPTLFDLATVEKSKLRDTSLWQQFVRQPIRLIDVGARWGPPPFFDPLGKLFSVWAFDADYKATSELDKQNATRYADYSVSAIALGAAKSTMMLRVRERANLSSTYDVDVGLVKRYGMQGYDTVEHRDIAVMPLDSVVSDARRGPEVLKVDVEGMELEVLMGARNSLYNTACVITEVSFMPLNRAGPLFADIDQYLRHQAFDFYGFRDMHSIKGRLSHADAVYFSSSGHPRLMMVQVVMATLLGFFDFAHELVDRLTVWGNHELVKDLHGPIGVLSLLRSEDH